MMATSTMNVLIVCITIVVLVWMTGRRKDD